MPFVPVNMPGVGISTLKSTLASRGIRSEIYYGALEFLKFFADQIPMRDLRRDYDLIATNMHVGELFFSGTLWNDGVDVTDLCIERLTRSAAMFSGGYVERMAVRLRTYAENMSNLIEHCYNARDWNNFDIVGFSSTFAQNVSSLALAQRIRSRHPHVCIVFGGANCESVMGEQLIRSFPQIDVVIRGEADFAFPEFVERFRRGEPLRDVPGIVFREGGGIVVGAEPRPVLEMETLPVPDYDDYFEQQPKVTGAEARPDHVLPIETSRGCWWGAVKHCIFCGLNPTMMKFRSKSGERALCEFRHLKARYGLRRFYAVDNIMNKQYFHSLLPQLKDEDIEIFYETKSNLSEFEVGQLASAGIRNIQPGIESLNSEILALMEKGVKGYQNIELLKWCAMNDIGVTWLYLYGFPNESAEAFLSDVDKMDKLHHLPPPKTANPILLDRYSPMFTRREQYGLRHVRATSESLKYYRGLSEAEAFGLSYHFDMELPQGAKLPYADALSRAVLRWKYEYLRGARFYQFDGEKCTLLLDTRRGGFAAFLLDGAGARIHRALRRARQLDDLRDEAFADGDITTTALVADLPLVQIASYLGARSIASPPDAAGVTAFLDELANLGIVLAIDRRYLALAIDCTQEQEAQPFGLGNYVVRRGPGRAYAVQHTRPPSLSSPADRALQPQGQ